MILTKSFDYFDPNKVSAPIHIIGCGSIGSNLASTLARFGLDKFELYDFDKVEGKNIVNQDFYESQIGMLKVDAVEENLLKINREIKVNKHPEGYTNQTLNGYVFLAIDSIELRKKICKDNKLNSRIKLVMDFRTRLVDAQCYTARWDDFEAVEFMIDSMNFTDEEARLNSPRTACGSELGVCTTVKTIVCFGANNFRDFITENEYKRFINVFIKEANIISF